MGSSLHADFDLRKFQSTSDIGIERNITVNDWFFIWCLSKLRLVSTSLFVKFPLSCHFGETSGKRGACSDAASRQQNQKQNPGSLHRSLALCSSGHNISNALLFQQNFIFGFQVYFKWQASAPSCREASPAHPAYSIWQHTTLSNTLVKGPGILYNLQNRTVLQKVWWVFLSLTKDIWHRGIVYFEEESLKSAAKVAQFSRGKEKVSKLLFFQKGVCSLLYETLEKQGTR